VLTRVFSILIYEQISEIRELADNKALYGYDVVDLAGSGRDPRWAGTLLSPRLRSTGQQQQHRHQYQVYQPETT
jgi:hypothetical protein